MATIKDTMCFKTWHDLTIDLPQKHIYWCCKTVLDKSQIEPATFTEHTLSLDFIKNNPIIKQRKQELMTGIRAIECKECWDSEDLTGNSFRTNYQANSFSNKTDSQIIELARQDLTKKIEIVLTNKCNSACVYCWEGLSSRWQKETGKYFNDTEIEILDKTIDVLTEYWQTDLQHKNDIEISLLGGEPFFTDHMFYFIENFCNKIDNENIIVNITTNLNYNSSLLEKFFNIIEDSKIRYNIVVSAEAIENKFEYIRWGSKWKTWDDNFDVLLVKKLEYENVTITIGSAHNFLSVPYINDLLNYIENKKIKFPIQLSSNWVEFPPELSVKNLQPHHKLNIDDAIENVRNMKTKIINRKQYINTLTSIKNQVGTLNVDKSFYDVLEKRRNISFSDVFPHFHELVKTDK
jgi:hypothetical protein